MSVAIQFAPHASSHLSHLHPHTCPVNIFTPASSTSSHLLYLHPHTFPFYTLTSIPSTFSHPSRLHPHTCPIYNSIPVPFTSSYLSHLHPHTCMYPHTFSHSPDWFYMVTLIIYLFISKAKPVLFKTLNISCFTLSCHTSWISTKTWCIRFFLLLSSFTTSIKVLPSPLTPRLLKTCCSTYW